MVRPRALRLPRVLVPVVGLAGVAAALTLPGGHAPTLFQRVAVHPAGFAARQVKVTGQVRPAPGNVPHGYRGAFVLTGPEGRRLLVVPPLGGRLPATAPGSLVTVRGEVVPLAPSADDRRRRDTVVALGDLAERADARAILQADAVTPPPG